MRTVRIKLIAINGRKYIIDTITTILIIVWRMFRSVFLLDAEFLVVSNGILVIITHIFSAKGRSYFRENAYRMRR